VKSLSQLLIAEATEYEFKSAVEMNKPRSWLKTVSAFANGVGGSIYFGVDDKTQGYRA
jgi:ATP-dependent DNA helicase RecG